MAYIKKNNSKLFLMSVAQKSRTTAMHPPTKIIFFGSQFLYTITVPNGIINTFNAKIVGSRLDAFVVSSSS